MKYKIFNIYHLLVCHSQTVGALLHNISTHTFECIANDEVLCTIKHWAVTDYPVHVKHLLHSGKLSRNSGKLSRTINWLFYEFHLNLENLHH